MNPEHFRHPASFRDPSGFVFFHEGKAHRAVAPACLPEYNQLMSGLYAALVKKGWLLPHEELHEPAADHAYKILLPQQVPYWSYPYEWSFSQLKDAALLTLRISLLALQHNMVLKDASAYNIQFVGGKPVFIDTLSFEAYQEGRPWKAFRQFCAHFLYPLLLQIHQPGTDMRILQAYPDGLPATMIRSILPGRKRWNLNYWLYVFLPAKLETRPDNGKTYTVSRTKVLQNLQQLESFIGKLQLPALHTTWNDYYSDTILSREYLDRKKEIVAAWLEELPGNTICDLGCNDGVFSELAAHKAQHVWALDGDAACIETLYLTAKKQKQHNILPLVSDLSNPVPAGGWNNAERLPVFERVGSDTVLALALIHHLCLAKNVSLEMVADVLGSLAQRHLIIEFVPKEDPKAQLLLQHKGDIFPHYTQATFEAAFASRFEILSTEVVKGSSRTLYLMRRRQH